MMTVLGSDEEGVCKCIAIKWGSRFCASSWVARGLCCAMYTIVNRCFTVKVDHRDLVMLQKRIATCKGLTLTSRFPFAHRVQIGLVSSHFTFRKRHVALDGQGGYMDDSVIRS